MVNTNIQGPIVLSGPGLRYRDYGNYDRGEYRELSNVEITSQGVLRTRRSITQPLQGSGDYTSALGFVGSVDNFAWAVTESSIFPVGEQTYTGDLPDSPSNLPDQAGDHYHHVVGFFKYNNTYYWLTANYDGTNVKFYIYSSSTINSTFAAMDATKTLITTVKPQGSDPEAYQYAFKDFFLFKDRLFVVTHEGVWFSKATDPMVFTVPDGGFFKVPDQEINASVAVSDSVYLATNKAIHVFSYSADPNTDGYMRPITTDLGAWSLAVNEGAVYASNKYSLFTITGSGVDRVIDFEDVVPTRAGIRNKLISFENYLLVMEYRVKNKTGEVYPLNVAYRNDTDESNRIITFNIKNGAAHRIDFEDFVSNADRTTRGRIVDAIITRPSYDDDPTIVFMTSRRGVSDYDNSFYLMDYPKLSSSTGYDQIRDSLGNRYVKINQKVTIDSFSPDGSEHMMKKFRAIYGMAQLPVGDFELALSYDNRDESRVAEINSGGMNEPDPKPHHPIRFPLNQRARSITLKFRTRNVETLTETEPPNHFFELSDLRVFWLNTMLPVRTKAKSV